MTIFPAPFPECQWCVCACFSPCSTLPCALRWLLWSFVVLLWTIVAYCCGLPAALEVPGLLFKLVAYDVQVLLLPLSYEGALLCTWMCAHAHTVAAAAAVTHTTTTTYTTTQQRTQQPREQQTANSKHRLKQPESDLLPGRQAHLLPNPLRTHLAPVVASTQPCAGLGCSQNPQKPNAEHNVRCSWPVSYFGAAVFAV